MMKEVVKEMKQKKKALEFTWISTEFKVAVCDTILLSYAFWGMLSCIYWFVYQCIVRIHLFIYEFIYIILLIYTYYLSEYAFIPSQILCYLYSKISPMNLDELQWYQWLRCPEARKQLIASWIFEEAKGWTKTCNWSFYDYTPEN